MTRARVSVRNHSAIAYDAGGYRTAETVTAAQPAGSSATVGGFQALYGHDLAGRLISWKSPFARADTARETDTMTLDDGGNIMSTNTTAAEGSDTEVATSTLTAGRLASRVTDSTTAAGTTRTNESFSYSPFGEETSRSTTVTPPPSLGSPVSETTTTTYDPAGYTASSTTGSTTVSYTYDPVTERVLTRQTQSAAL